jgi:hypothetical protein
VLRCSVWWVKEQARHRRIPYCWIGGSYRFTAEHLAEIVHLFEVRPVEAGTSVGPVRQSARSTTGEQESDSVVRLHARPPRRVRNLDMPDSSAA